MLQPEPPRRALHFDPEGRPQVRFRRNSFSPLSPPGNHIANINWSRYDCRGPNASEVSPEPPIIQPEPDTNPITPGTAEKNGEERKLGRQGTTNFAQRIEKKMWTYSTSQNVYKRWLLEIISWSVSAACMAGIVIMLIIYKNKHIPTNWPLGLTLNAYISNLSKIASAALLLPVSEALGQLKWSWFQGGDSKKMWDFEIFDNASRGPWGSLLLLVRTRGRSLAALGAAVTIFALALDPFFQQLVEYPNKWEIQKETGSLPIARGYMRSLPNTEYRNNNELLELDPDMLAVSNHYFYSNGTIPVVLGTGIRAEVPLACPSSNCTWPEYETLGMCSKCTDASDLLEFKCLHKELDWAQLPDMDENDYAVYPNGTSCGWFLAAENPLLMTGYNVDRNTAHTGEILIYRTQPLYDVNSRVPLAGINAKLNNTRNPLSHVIIVSGKTVEDVQRNATPIAHECLISWCAKQMTSTYSEGSFTENITKVVRNETQDQWPWIVSPIFEHGIKVALYYDYSEDVYLRGESGAQYFIDRQTHLLTINLYDDIFPSTYTLINSTNEDDARLHYKQYINQGIRTRNMPFNPFLYSNISAHLDNYANKMTNLMRSSLSRAEMISGTAYGKGTFVNVRWEWLTLPLVLLGLSLFFLVSTVVRSSIEKDNVGVYKTSAMATLLYGLPDDMQKKLGKSKVPREEASQVKVKWHPKAGWRMSGNSVSSTSDIRPPVIPHEPDMNLRRTA